MRPKAERAPCRRSAGERLSQSRRLTFAPARGCIGHLIERGLSDEIQSPEFDAV